MNGNEFPPGNQPVVNINGEKIRRLREHQGLTQLYLATSVGVTTDTISRWENRRYPTIKKENALKLAEALNVSLDDIIDIEDATEKPTSAPKATPEPQPEKLSNNRRLPWIIISVVGLALIMTIFFWRLTGNQPEMVVSATRILPPHMVPGQAFPVLIKIDNSFDQTPSLIIKESFPANCEPIVGVPPFTAQDKKRHFLKWISKASDDRNTFAYLVHILPEVNEHQQLTFSGNVTLGKGRGVANIVGGADTLLARNFHWADTNADNIIDDEEILAVYDDYGAIDGLSIDREQIDAIWSGSGYRWDKEAKLFVVIP